MDAIEHISINTREKEAFIIGVVKGVGIMRKDDDITRTSPSVELVRKIALSMLVEDSEEIEALTSTGIER
jgi:hypothetical protein